MSTAELGAGASAGMTTARARTGRGPRATRSGVVRIGSFLATWLVLPWLVVSAFLAAVLPGGWLTLLAVLAYVLASVALRVRSFLGGAYLDRITRAVLLVPAIYVVLFMPFLALSALLGATLGLPFGAALTGGRFAIEVVFVLLSGLAVAGYFGSKRLVVKPVDVQHGRVPAAFSGVRIAQLSDLHVGPHTSRAFLERIAQQVERAQPDVIVFTGDLVDDHADDAQHFLRAFGHLKAPLGVYAIPGNHDVYAGWERVEAQLSAGGLTVLVNDGVALRREGGTFWIGGTGDPAAGRADGRGRSPAPDLDRTMASAPADAFRLVLAHNPALWRGLAARGAHLTLSGHTHHGQLSIPGLNWSMASMFLEHAMNRYDSGDAVLYINPGTNFWGLPFRLGAWPEITMVTVRA